MNWHEWIRQSLPRTEIMRGGATVWEVGAKGLNSRLEMNDFVHVLVDTAYGIAAGMGAASVLIFQMPGI